MKAIAVEHKRNTIARTMRLILLLGMIIFLTACAGKPKDQEAQAAKIQEKWTEQVSKEIKDPVRVEKVISLGVQYMEKSRALFPELEKVEQEIKDVNRNYDSTRSDYELVLGKFNERRAEALRQYLDSLFALRQQTTPEEWKTLTR